MKFFGRDFGEFVVEREELPADVAVCRAIRLVLGCEDGAGDIVGLEDFDSAGVSEVFGFGGELVEGEFASGIGGDDDFGF